MEFSPRAELVKSSHCGMSINFFNLGPNIIKLTYFVVIYMKANHGSH